MNFSNQLKSIGLNQEPFICRIEDYCSRWGLIQDNFINWLKSAGEPYNRMATDDGYFLFDENTQPIQSFPWTKEQLFKETVFIQDFIDTVFKKDVLYRSGQYIGEYHTYSKMEVQHYNLKLGETYQDKPIFGIYNKNTFYINFFHKI